MNLNRPNIKRAVIFMLLSAAAIAIASLTIGKEIYGSKEHTLLSFAIINLSGYLFFIFMPVELAFIYYLNTSLNIALLNLTAIGTAIFSQAIDYYIGRSFSKQIIDQLIGRQRYEKAESEIRKYGNIAIFVFNLLPLSSPVILLAAGMLKHRLKEAFLYSLAGLLVKYLILSAIF
ncbi:MAG: VTT domain-containing protein [Prolixibacteraceae bacterium]